MHNHNLDFLKTNLEFAQKKGFSQEKYAIDNEVDFIAWHYLGLKFQSASFRRQESLLFDRFINTLGLLERISCEVPLVLIKMAPGFEVVRSDLDVLCRKDSDILALRRILKEHGFRRLAYPKFYRWQPANERFKQIFNASDSKFLSVHLHRHIAWGSVLYLEGTKVFHEAQKKEIFNKNFLIPQPQVYLTILILHIIFENFKLSLKDFLEAKELLAFLGADLEGFKEDLSWRAQSAKLFKKNFSLVDARNGCGSFPLSFSRNSLMGIHLNKIFTDFKHHLKPRDTYFDIEACFFDFLKLFVIWPLRKHGVIR